MSNPVVHFEMSVQDRERAKKFYSSAFGWNLQQLGEEMGNYVVAQTGPTDDKGMLQKTGMINGGLYQKQEDPAMNTPSVVIAVDDIRKHVKIVQDAGGKVLGEPMDIPGVGSYVSFYDTEGNRVSMLQPLPMN